MLVQFIRFGYSCGSGCVCEREFEQGSEGGERSGCTCFEWELKCYGFRQVILLQETTQVQSLTFYLSGFLAYEALAFAANLSI